MLNEPDRRYLSELRAEALGTLRSAIGAAPSVALLDFPWHQNVGDAMIWAGEVEYLRQLGLDVAYSSDLAHFEADAVRSLPDDSPILMHGGGNFGDIWPQFQKFRLEVALAFPQRKIIQLPQTVYFESGDEAKRTNEILGSHADYTLLVRDHISMERVQRLLPDVRAEFCTDMALGWSPAEPIHREFASVGVLRRQDHEQAGLLEEALAVSKTVRVFDWGLRGSEQYLWRAAKLPARLWRGAGPAWLRRSLSGGLRYGQSTMLRLNLHAGVREVGKHSYLVTDRLHAHVLAALLGVPHVVTDNSYGKISAIFDAYTGGFTTAHFASDISTIVSAIARGVEE